MYAPPSPKSRKVEQDNSLPSSEELCSPCPTGSPLQPLLTEQSLLVLPSWTLHRAESTRQEDMSAVSPKPGRATKASKALKGLPYLQALLANEEQSHGG